MNTNINLKSHVLQFIKNCHHKVKNPIIWKMFSSLEQIVMGGRYRKIIIKRITQIMGLYHLSPYSPKGFIYSIENWLNGPIPLQMKGSWVKLIIPNHLIYLNKPNHIKYEIHPNFAKFDKPLLIPNSYLCYLKNARIVNEEGIVISYDDKVYVDLNFEDKKSIRYDVFKSYINKPIIKKECLATISSNAHANIFHWIFDILPRLKLLEDVLEDIDYLIVPHDLNQFQLDSLNQFGFPPEKLLRIKNGTHLLCEKLYATSFPRKEGMIPKWACDFIRDSIILKNGGNPHRLIYISRKDAFFRKIINEKEVEDCLSNIGFEIIQMSKLSFSEQVRICAEARVVVGSHGAGLTNTVFCRNAKILELFSPLYVPTMYWMISNHVGNSYYYLLGESVEGNTYPEWADFRINIEMFKKNIELLLEYD